MTQHCNSDIDLEDEFENVKQWAKDNRMTLNFLKTKEIVFRRPNPKLFVYPSPLPQIEQVKDAKYWVLFCLKDYILMTMFLLS